MKRAILGTLLSLAAVPLLANEAWILNIPVRGIANQETGMVKILMTLSAAPAGSQIVVNGATTVNLGSTVAVSGDTITYEAVSGNDVRITYVPKSNFGVDFCAGGGANEKNVPMRFVGAQDVTDYRMSTYVVAAPMAECSQASKHTGDTPAALLPNDDGVAPALTATYKGRNTFDVALVLDKSGSMQNFPPGAVAGAKKFEILKSAVQGFVGQWELLDAPPGGGPEWSKDRIGVVFFDATAQSQTLAGADPPANFFLQRGNANPQPWDAVIAKANSLAPGSSTSIGGGTNEGMSQWKADPKNDLNVVVVTDGMQNTAPLVAPTGSGFLGLTPVAGLPQELRKRFIPIQTIAFGTPAQVDEDLLRAMSFETSGVSYQALNAASMFDLFGQTLVAILKGNTASMANRRIDTLTGAGPSADVPVLVDRSPQRVVFSVQWAPPGRQLLDLDVFPPGASSPAAPSASKKLPQAAMQAFDRNVPSGTWRVRVKRDLKQSEPVPYTLNVFFLEKHLDYQFSLDNLHAAAGDVLGIHVLVDWDGKPLTGLPDGAIRVRVLRQADSMGNVLREVRRETPTSNTVTPAGDVLTPLDAKIASFKGRSLLERIATKEVAVLPLKEQGRGIYAGTFGLTTVPGTYVFEAILDWDVDRTGHVHREERIEENVKLRADPAATEVKTARNGDVVTVSVTPRDRFGNFLGPGYASVVRARVRGGKLRSETPRDVRQIGTYEFTIGGVASGTTPDVAVSVDGVVVAGEREK